uniref:Uncharacterized protein n=1 Tax=Avena sativa TaxID=4498 RepID=A0ACD5WLV2_AVESA
MDMASRNKAYLLFPFPSQGHLAAFTSLACLLHRVAPSATVTLVSTARNVAALSAMAPPWLAFHSLPFSPSDHGLPAHAESTDALPIADMVTLFEAFESLQPAFDAYVQAMVAANASVVVVSDLFVAWAAGVARRHGCSHAFFTTCGAFGTAIMRTLWENTPLSVTPAGHVSVAVPPGFPDGILLLHTTQISGLLLRADGQDRWSAFYRRQIAHSGTTDGVLVNTVEELEPTGLAMLRSSLHNVVPVWPVGPLIRAAASSPDNDGIITWLDSQPIKSVLYISFGSQNSITQAQMARLAMALERTRRPFVWAIRPPVGLAADVAGGEWLPEGFDERARHMSRGLVVRCWAPQVRILAHHATGAFLSHCGWNSVLESLAHGVPLIGWPLAADQFYNVEMLARKECGVCVEVARGNTEDDVPKVESVAELVETVMGKTAKAAEMRMHVENVSEQMRDTFREDGGSSMKSMTMFLEATRGRMHS